ncbi:hypothetical protein DFP72DRAFT_130961 [Ephemerocybe angulata]|uniref:Uncharacterized protein n=1 Tax=Ephemerocybe angulata TaxID=980116 RepID=A0A8H6LW32_9AGAR|nr:hypothetical protein DFP72DRAFT_130961 [Tulosesus angulatus]
MSRCSHRQRDENRHRTLPSTLSERPSAASLHLLDAFPSRSPAHQPARREQSSWTAPSSPMMSYRHIACLSWRFAMLSPCSAFALHLSHGHTCLIYLPTPLFIMIAPVSRQTWIRRAGYASHSLSRHVSAPWPDRCMSCPRQAGYARSASPRSRPAPAPSFPSLPSQPFPPRSLGCTSPCHGLYSCM